MQELYIIADNATRERESGTLWAIKDNYPKYVVSMDELDFSHDGIQHYNIRKFLQLPHDLLNM